MNVSATADANENRTDIEKREPVSFLTGSLNGASETRGRKLTESPLRTQRIPVIRRLFDLACFSLRHPILECVLVRGLQLEFFTVDEDARARHLPIAFLGADANENRTDIEKREPVSFLTGSLNGASETRGRKLTESPLRTQRIPVIRRLFDLACFSLRHPILECVLVRGLQLEFFTVDEDARARHLPIAFLG